MSDYPTGYPVALPPNSCPDVKPVDDESVQQAALRHSVPDFTPVFEGDLLELARPCLRHVDLEVDIVMANDDFDDAWFAAGDVELAADTIGFGDGDELYLPEPRRVRIPVTIGVAFAALAVVLFIAT